MTYIKVSIPKQTEGTAVPKKANVIVMLADEIETEPSRSHGNIALSGSFALASGAKAIGLYLTPSTIEVGYDAEGDDDAKGFRQRVAGDHPGNDVDIENFIEATINKGVVIIVKGCDGTSAGVSKVYGSKCAPLILSPEVTDSKDGNKAHLAWQQTVAQAFLPGIYTGTEPDLAGESSESSSSSSSSEGA